MAVEVEEVESEQIHLVTERVGSLFPQMILTIKDGQVEMNGQDVYVMVKGAIQDGRNRQDMEF